MTLRRRDEFQSTMLVLMVVPTHESLRPCASLVDAAKRLARVVWPIFPGPEQRRVGIVIAHTCRLNEASSSGRLPGPGKIYLGQNLRSKAPVRPGDTVHPGVDMLAIVVARCKDIDALAQHKA